VGSPAYNVFGWQKPCYLLQDGYVKTFKEYIEEHQTGQLRQQEQQPEVPGLHGPVAASTQRG